MRIESGSTNDRLLRLLAFLVMCIGMAAWFAYDGWKGYPAKNLEWSVQAMPDKPEDPQTNPLAVISRLRTVHAGMSPDEVRARLGEPTLLQEREYRFEGPALVVIARIADGHVTALESRDLDPERRPERPNHRVTAAVLDQLSQGMSEAALRNALGDPTSIRPETWWFVGRAAYGRVIMEHGQVGESRQFVLDPREGTELREGAISDGLISEFKRQGIHLRSDATVSSGDDPSIWMVSGGDQQYVIRRDATGFTVYGGAEVHENRERTEGDIFLQKVIAVGLGGLALVVLFFLLRAYMTRVVVDERGLTFNRTHVPWDAMAGLGTEDYARKGWLDLNYEADGSTRKVRLDSYHIDRFNEIMDAICERKGYAVPRVRAAEEPEQDTEARDKEELEDRSEDLRES